MCCVGLCGKVWVQINIFLARLVMDRDERESLCVCFELNKAEMRSMPCLN